MSSPRLSAERAGSPFIAVLSSRRLFRDCLLDFLERHGFAHVAGYDGWTNLLRAATRQAPDLVLLDLQSGEEGSPVLRAIRTRWPDATAVALGNPAQLGAHAAEADGWLELTDPAARLGEMAAAVARPHRGRLKFPASSGVEQQLRVWSELTRRQRQVLGLLGCGVANHHLATALGISQRAVKAHISALLVKFAVSNRTELALVACRAGLRCPRDSLAISA